MYVYIEISYPQILAFRRTSATPKKTVDITGAVCNGSQSGDIDGIWRNTLWQPATPTVCELENHHSL